VDAKTHKVVLTKEELDKAAKDKHHKHYAADLSLELEFETATERIARISLEKEKADQEAEKVLDKKKKKKKDGHAVGGGAGGVGGNEEEEIDLMDMLSGPPEHRDSVDSNAEAGIQGNDGVWD